MIFNQTNGSGGGGSSSWTHLAHAELLYETTSTAVENIGSDISCGSAVLDPSKPVYVRVRDMAGKRNGYFYGTDEFFFPTKAATWGTKSTTNTFVTTDGVLTARGISTTTGNVSAYGLYAYNISTEGVVDLRGRYNANYSLTIDGTYSIDVFTLDYPDGYPSPFIEE